MAHEKVLLVEGDEDKRVIPQLVEANGVQWGNRKKDWIVEIKALGSVERLLDKEEINIQLKDSGLKILGIILDADDAPANRWQSIRNCLLERRGMLETFLQFLLPENDKDLWEFAEQSCRQAANCGAPYKEAHLDKAKIHTWLAWQNPPGRQLHNAIMERILTPASPQAAPFMQWFQRLFEIPAAE